MSAKITVGGEWRVFMMRLFPFQAGYRGLAKYIEVERPFFEL